MSEIIWLESIDSTNNEVKRRILDLDNLSVIAAGEQYAGRGQRGNKWISKAWENLTFSILFRPKENHIIASKQFIISQIATLSINEYLHIKGIKSKIKWPNDIYVGNKKICGMLIENTLKNNYVESSIIGIGINVNQIEFPPELFNPTSMKLLSKNDYNVKKELEDIINIFQKYIPLINEEDEIKNMYISDLYRLNTYFNYYDKISKMEFSGKIIDIYEDGRIVIENILGDKKSFNFKEISYII